MGVTIADLNHVHRRGSGACRPTRPSLGSRQRRGLRRVGHAQRQWPMALGPLRHTALHIMGVIEVARVRHTALARSLTASFFRIDFARALQWLARSTDVFVEFHSTPATPIFNVDESSTSASKDNCTHAEWLSQMTNSASGVIIRGDDAQLVFCGPHSSINPV